MIATMIPAHTPSPGSFEDRRTKLSLISRGSHRGKAGCWTRLALLRDEVTFQQWNGRLLGATINRDEEYRNILYVTINTRISP